MRFSNSSLPPCITYTRWCPSHRDAVRSHPGHWQCRSRALSARRLGPRIVGSARLTSITTESWSRTRVRLQSQAQRSTVFDEIGRENSVSAPGAPVRSSRVFVLNGVPAPWLRGESMHLDLRLVA